MKPGFEVGAVKLRQTVRKPLSQWDICFADDEEAIKWLIECWPEDKSSFECGNSLDNLWAHVTTINGPALVAIRKKNEGSTLMHVIFVVPKGTNRAKSLQWAQHFNDRKRQYGHARAEQVASWDECRNIINGVPNAAQPATVAQPAVQGRQRAATLATPYQPRLVPIPVPDQKSGLVENFRRNTASDWLLVEANSPDKTTLGNGYENLRVAIEARSKIALFGCVKIRFEGLRGTTGNLRAAANFKYLPFFFAPNKFAIARLQTQWQQFLNNFNASLKPISEMQLVALLNKLAESMRSVDSMISISEIDTRHPAMKALESTFIVAQKSATAVNELLKWEKYGTWTDEAIAKWNSIKGSVSAVGQSLATKFDNARTLSKAVATVFDEIDRHLQNPNSTDDTQVMQALKRAHETLEVVRRSEECSFERLWAEMDPFFNQLGVKNLQTYLQSIEAVDTKIFENYQKMSSHRAEIDDAENKLLAAEQYVTECEKAHEQEKTREEVFKKPIEAVMTPDENSPLVQQMSTVTAELAQRSASQLEKRAKMLGEATAQREIARLKAERVKTMLQAEISNQTDLASQLVAQKHRLEAEVKSHLQTYGARAVQSLEDLLTRLMVVPALSSQLNNELLKYTQVMGTVLKETNFVFEQYRGLTSQLTWAAFSHTTESAQSFYPGLSVQQYVGLTDQQFKAALATSPVAAFDELIDMEVMARNDAKREYALKKEALRLKLKNTVVNEFKVSVATVNKANKLAMLN